MPPGSVASPRSPGSPVAKAAELMSEKDVQRLKSILSASRSSGFGSRYSRGQGSLDFSSLSSFPAMDQVEATMQRLQMHAPPRVRIPSRSEAPASPRQSLAAGSISPRAISPRPSLASRKGSGYPVDDLDEDAVLSDLQMRQRGLRGRTEGPGDGGAGGLDVDTTMHVQRLIDCTREVVLNRKAEIRKTHEALEEALRELAHVKAEQEEMLQKRIAALTKEFDSSVAELQRKYQAQVEECKNKLLEGIKEGKIQCESTVQSKVENLLGALASGADASCVSPTPASARRRSSSASHARSSASGSSSRIAAQYARLRQQVGLGLGDDKRAAPGDDLQRRLESVVGGSIKPSSPTHRVSIATNSSALGVQLQRVEDSIGRASLWADGGASQILRDNAGAISPRSARVVDRSDSLADDPASPRMSLARLAAARERSLRSPRLNMSAGGGNPFGRGGAKNFKVLDLFRVSWWQFSP
eukprot:jgi/Mesvir1/23533/Mv18234-RA.1